MEIIFRITLFVTGIVNLLPSFLAFLPARISQSYGVVLPDASFELLLRHRAILFGIVGGLMVFSAIVRRYYDLAAISGLVSMISFVALYFLIGDGISQQLTKVMRIDLVAIVLLLVGLFLFKLKQV